MSLTNKSQEEEQINNKNDDDERYDRGKRSASQGYDQIVIKDNDSRMNMRRIINYSNVSNSNNNDLPSIEKKLVHDDKRSKLTITVLSMHGLPLDNNDNNSIDNDNTIKLEPQNVTLETLGGQMLTIGPPISRHKKQKNDFKYCTQNKNSNSAANNNEFIIIAPLSSIYSSTLKFTVILKSSTMSSEDANANITNMKVCNLSSYHTKVSNITTAFNETKSLIVPLKCNKNKKHETTASASASTSTSLRNDDHENNDDTMKSALRINIRLETISYRPEIFAIRCICYKWFTLVDCSCPYMQSIGNYISKDLPSKLNPTVTKCLLLSSIIPTSIFIITSLPIISIIFVLGFPIVFTLLLIVGFIISSIIIFFLVFYCSTKHKRNYAYNTILSPISTSFLSTTIGQQMIYNTGSRPSFSDMLQSTLSTENIMCKLCICLTIDSIGSSTYLLPIIGESFDILWAPMQYYCMSVLSKQNSLPCYFKYASFMEEILPFTDIIPSATICWLWEYYYYSYDHKKPFFFVEKKNNNGGKKNCLELEDER